MQPIYIVCFVLLGIGALANLIAFIFLLLSSNLFDWLFDWFGRNDIEDNLLGSFKLFIHQPITDLDINSGELDERKGGEDDKPLNSLVFYILSKYLFKINIL